MMTLYLCAWHREYWGYLRPLSLRFTRGWGLMRSHGICRACAARLRSKQPSAPSLWTELLRALLALACVVAYGALAVGYDRLRHGGQ